MNNNRSNIIKTMTSQFQSAEYETLPSAAPAAQQQQQQPQPQHTAASPPTSKPQNEINQQITSIMTFISSFDKNESNVEKIWSLLTMYFTFLEKIQHILVPIISKVYAIHDKNRIISLLNKINQIKSSTDLLDTVIQLRVGGVLTQEETELINTVKLEFQENRSVLTIVKEIISNLDNDKRRDLETKFSKAMLPYTSTGKSNKDGAEGARVGGDDKKHVSFLENEVTIPVVSKKFKMKWIILIVIIVLLLILTGGYFIYTSSSKGAFGTGGSVSDGYLSDAMSVVSQQSSIGASS